MPLALFLSWQFVNILLLNGNIDSSIFSDRKIRLKGSSPCALGKCVQYHFVALKETTLAIHARFLCTDPCFLLYSVLERSIQ